nr:B3 domain-containing protein REM10-like [Ipomoea batatas]
MKTIPPKNPHFFMPIHTAFKNGVDIPTYFLAKYLKGQAPKFAIPRRGDRSLRVKISGGCFDLRLGVVAALFLFGALASEAAGEEASNKAKSSSLKIIEENVKFSDYNMRPERPIKPAPRSYRSGNHNSGVETETETPAESISHLMFKCGFAISCLKNFPNILLNVDMSMEEWVSWHIKALDNVSCCLLLTTCWKIWGARNQKLWSNYSSNPSIVVEDAKAFFEAWSSIHTYSPRRNKQKDFEKWEKPPRSWLKVNTYAALDSQGRHIGLGFVLRTLVQNCTSATVVKDFSLLLYNSSGWHSL